MTGVGTSHPSDHYDREAFSRGLTANGSSGDGLRHHPAPTGSRPCELTAAVTIHVVAAMLLAAIAPPSLAQAQQPGFEQPPAGVYRLHPAGRMRGPAFPPITTTQDTTRHRAVEYSDAYYTRLTIHRIGSYVELPLFAAEYLSRQQAADRGGARWHVATSFRRSVGAQHGGWQLGVLFAVNTVTGVWNLIEARHTQQGRARRWIHSISKLVADGGFFLTESAAGDAKKSDAGATRHRNLAIASISVATASTVMMWLWKK